MRVSMWHVARANAGVNGPTVLFAKIRAFYTNTKAQKCKDSLN